MSEDYKNWDWKKNDKEFYDKASKTPEFNDEKYREMLKRKRYNEKGRQYRIDMRPKAFFKTMRLELIVFGFGVTCALMLPFYMKSISRKRHENQQEKVREAYENMGFGNRNMYKNELNDRGGVVKVENNRSSVLGRNDINQDMDQFFMEVEYADKVARDNPKAYHNRGLGTRDLRLDHERYQERQRTTKLGSGFMSPETKFKQQ